MNPVSKATLTHMQICHGLISDAERKIALLREYSDSKKLKKDNLYIIKKEDYQKDDTWQFTIGLPEAKAMIKTLHKVKKNYEKKLDELALKLVEENTPKEN